MRRPQQPLYHILKLLIASAAVKQESLGSVSCFAPCPSMFISRRTATAAAASPSPPTNALFQHLSKRTFANSRQSKKTAAGRTATTLHSLQPLIQDLHALAESRQKQQQQQQPLSDPPPVVFVGGKGGVGKTSVSASLAVALSNVQQQQLKQGQNPSPLKVLIVSTDPAHSLGDAFDVNLQTPPRSVSSSSSSTPQTVVRLTDPLTGGNLFAQEVDASLALDQFRQSLQAFDVETLALSLGVDRELLEGLGLQELNGLLNNPPPGLDELVALTTTVLGDDDTSAYDVILVDTAPTGHTLRLLQLPQFLDGVLGRLIRLRSKLAGLASTIQSIFASTTTFSAASHDDARQKQQQKKQTLENAAASLENFQRQIKQLQRRLKDPRMTRFVIVTVPTTLAVAETKRLLTELTSQGVSVTDVVINQCVGERLSVTSAKEHYQRRKLSQTKWIRNLQSAMDEVSASSPYQNNYGASGPIQMITVPYFDVELVGIPALGYVGSQVFVDNPSFSHLMRHDWPSSTRELQSQSQSSQSLPPRLVICGGKGGVGKTTTAASLAITLAAQGHQVVVISTDPAHSLGDALAVSLSSTSRSHNTNRHPNPNPINTQSVVTSGRIRAGQNIVDCGSLLIGVPGNTGDGSLSALEIDPASAIRQFKGWVDNLVFSGAGVAGIGVAGETFSDASPGGGRDSSSKGSSLASALADLEGMFDTLPAGTDEVVALAQIVQLIRKGNFDRIVLDTAPTGHTLRMLSTPTFLADLIDRLLAIAERINSHAAVRLLLSSRGKNQEGQSAFEMAKSQLLTFQRQMYELEDLWADAEHTEFLIVTIATELAARESIRLVRDLTFESPDLPLKVRNVIVNQVLPDDEDEDDEDDDDDTPGTDSIGRSSVRSVFLSHQAQTQSRAIKDLRQAIAVSSMSSSESPPPRVTTVPVLDTEPRGVYGLRSLADAMMQSQSESESQSHDQSQRDDSSLRVPIG